ncbi:MAG: type I-G CRISPR-associated RAMP protein Csb1/Cas7g [Myxococcales bacterium]
MTDTPKLSAETIDRWATDRQGPVALHLKQKLHPVEGEGGVIFPPTYADIGYNIDTLSDGTRVATIDSVGSQANRLEPLFKATNADEALVPQIEILLREKGAGKKGEDGAKQDEKRSILDLAHRGADAVVQSSPTLAPIVAKAFEALHSSGDAGPLCALAPTSLVFGVWDSRGGTGEKRPRLVRSIIRAWDVDVLHSAAQFNSISKALSEEQREALDKEAKAKKIKLSVKGLADAPAVFRKAKVQKFIDGAPNPEARVLGGVVVKGRIERDVTVNLVALRGLQGNSPEETTWIRRYLLGLSLQAATTDIDLFLREGCLLRYSGEDLWSEVPRRGDPVPVDLTSGPSKQVISKYASAGAAHFRKDWPEELVHAFDLKKAKELLAKESEDEEEQDPEV